MLCEAAERMKRLGVSDLPVMENNEIVGWIADIDIVRAVAAGRDPTTTPVQETMTRGQAPDSGEPVFGAAAETREEHPSKEIPMKARVTEDCISCGRCVEICPEVFELSEDKAVVKTDPIPEAYQDAAQEAADECPTSAIIIER
jgi:ferredoxin